MKKNQYTLSLLFSISLFVSPYTASAAQENNPSTSSKKLIAGTILATSVLIAPKSQPTSSNHSNKAPSQAATHCNHCTASVPEAANFCTQCGKPIQAVDTQTQQISREQSPEIVFMPSDTEEEPAKPQLAHSPNQKVSMHQANPCANHPLNSPNALSSYDENEKIMESTIDLKTLCKLENIASSCFSFNEKQEDPHLQKALAESLKDTIKDNPSNKSPKENSHQNHQDDIIKFNEQYDALTNGRCKYEKHQIDELIDKFNKLKTLKVPDSDPFKEDKVQRIQGLLCSFEKQIEKLQNQDEVAAHNNQNKNEPVSADTSMASAQTDTSISDIAQIIPPELQMQLLEEDASAQTSHTQSNADALTTSASTDTSISDIAKIIPENLQLQFLQDDKVVQKNKNEPFSADTSMASAQTDTSINDIAQIIPPELQQQLLEEDASAQTSHKQSNDKEEAYEMKMDAAQQAGQESSHSSTEVSKAICESLKAAIEKTKDLALNDQIASLEKMLSEVEIICTDNNNLELKILYAKIQSLILDLDKETQLKKAS
ncbi:MAG: zinc ribbon domain-containing protein [Bacteroidota bacterium]